MRIGVLTGLTVEARLLDEPAFKGTQAPLIAQAGACAKRAAIEAERLVALGAGALVSFGIAAGLDPRLRVGDLVFADRVILPDGGSVETDADWLELARAQSAGRMHAASSARSREPTELLATAADKRSLAACSGALCGDMESAAAALVAARAGLPLLVVRAISDSAAQDPARRRAGAAAAGRRDQHRPGRAGAVRRPGEWLAVARLAFDTRAALERYAAWSDRERSAAGLGGRRLDGLAHQPIEDVLGRPLPV
jgi:adenosylhomocysteine nucleosidase